MKQRKKPSERIRQLKLHSEIQQRMLTILVLRLGEAVHFSDRDLAEVDLRQVQPERTFSGITLTIRRPLIETVGGLN